ncbi:uncharacterized protein EI90DRAFT_3004468 [Cantharellus anzutake]|uniref:uncharacterized protein n=1 Tax=Cantharellus anzutake TaxID=1750568 RepID=UPI0019060EE4|nr:uncharacterized protein EI90DRAFT_3004468 [Cantharellus anzutake]KAF8312777.1 hypothetical protein EI90DRAFT_3004468 [Cantharellus anzutake]
MATALINVLLAYNVYSAPTPPHNTTCFLQNVSDGYNDPRNYRMIWGILYSCLLTVFACIWTAVHPDLPQSYDDDASVLILRAVMMTWSLVLPEFTLALAWDQFLISRRISEKFEMVEGWTLTHSYFVVMNGFFDPSEGSVVGLNDLQQYPGIIENTGDTRKVAITQKEILDRSKGDAFSKIITVLQLLWFITQYAERWANHLHRSQLETMALAYVALYIFVYVLWWEKPVNAQFPIHVMRKSPSVPPTSETNVDQQTPKTEPDADPMSLVWVDEPKGLEFMSIFAATGIIFGGIHCLAWSFPFPTRTEMILWRVSAIYITVAPVLIFPIGWVAGVAWVKAWVGDCVAWLDDHVHESIIKGIVLLPPLVYAAARVTLTVLTFSSLHSPEPSPYQTPSWSSFDPHFG